MVGILLFALAISFACAQIDLPPSGYRYQTDGTTDYPLTLVAPVIQTTDNIDASFQRRANGMIYFAKGTDVWALPDPVYTSLGIMNGLGGVPPPLHSIYDFWPELQTGLPTPVTQIDAFLEAIDGTLYIFTGNYVFQYHDLMTWVDPTEKRGPASATRGTGWLLYQAPRRIERVFSGLPSSIDAAVQMNNGYFYFFKGPNYYRVPDRSIYGPKLAVTDLVKPMMVESCDPLVLTAGWDVTKPISTAYRSLSSRYIIFIHADATFTAIKDKFLLTTRTKDLQVAPGPTTPTPPLACVDQAPLDPATAAALAGPYDAIFQRRNGKIYIFIADMYYRLTDKLYTPHPWDCLDEGYPQKTMDNFPFPAAAAIDLTVTPIDAVFQRSNGKIYFFIGNNYYRFSDKYLDTEANPLLPDTFDYTKPILTNFGFTTDPTAGGTVPINSIYQKINGKIYIVMEDGVNTVYRLSDKYLVGGADDQLDEEYAAGTVTLADELFTPPFDLTVGPVRQIYQRTETDTKIHVLGGAAAGAAQLETLYFDQTLEWKEPCTKCTNDPAATDW